jgi:hypothetical protein
LKHSAVAEPLVGLAPFALFCACAGSIAAESTRIESARRAFAVVKNNRDMNSLHRIAMQFKLPIFTPPAGKPTTIRIGHVGWACALAMRDGAAARYRNLRGEVSDPSFACSQGQRARRRVNVRKMIDEANAPDGTLRIEMLEIRHVPRAAPLSGYRSVTRTRKGLE